ncbi:MAG TPA: HD domain-containing phosphohydrolase [Fibrobacteraceae bacterium]|nr:HD domain-containing phosphohydrolase [Fibrobacteraceae bacterium]
MLSALKLIVCLVSCWFAAAYATPVSTSSPGILDLRGWGSLQGTLYLSGEWEFFWNELLEPQTLHKASQYAELPGAWNRIPGQNYPAHGYATYHLHLRLPSTNHSLSLLMPAMSSSTRLFVNEKSYEVGNVATNAREYRPQYETLIIPLPKDTAVDLVMQVANFSHYLGGPWKPIEIGTPQKIMQEYGFSFMFRLILATVLLILGAYHAINFLYRREELIYFVFSGITICALSRLLIPGDHVISKLLPFMGWEQNVRLEYMLIAWVIPLIYLFAQHTYRSEVHPLPTRILIPTAVAYSIFALFAPTTLLTQSQVILQAIYILVAPLLLWFLGKAIYRHRAFAWLQFFGIFIIFIAALNDSLQAHQIVQSGYYASFALTIFVFLQWFLLASRQSRAFRLVETQLESFLMTLASAIESKDHYTGGHVERVAKYSRDLARAIGLPRETVRQIYWGAIIHDVGKIGIPDQILNKPGPLTEAEMTEMRKHPRDGWALIQKIEGIDVASEIALRHQERWDGHGYPDGLQGEQIPLEARIVAIADYWDAIITDRPYRKAMFLEQALHLLNSESDKGLDPKLLKVFFEKRIHLRYLDERK